MGLHSSASTLERRTGKYSIIIPERCNHYAEFMNHLSRIEVDAIFWCSLLSIISLLGCVVYLTQKAHYASRLQPDEEIGLDQTEIDGKRHQYRKNLFAVSLLCFLLAVLCEVMSAFAGLAIAWCFGEDLVNFYWSIWTLFGIGSCIAMLGTVLQQFYELVENPQPAWNFALGTPIPVMATIMHCFGLHSKKAWKTYKEKRKSQKGTSIRSSATKRSTECRRIPIPRFVSFVRDGRYLLEIEVSPENFQNLSFPDNFPTLENSESTVYSAEDGMKGSPQYGSTSSVVGTMPLYPQMVYPQDQTMDSGRDGVAKNADVPEEIGSGNASRRTTITLPPLRNQGEQALREQSLQDERRGRDFEKGKDRDLSPRE